MSVTETPKRPLVVLGAGVVGLTIAYLAAKDPDVSFDITVVARDMPEDMDSQAWASPFAGANWSPMAAGGESPRVYSWEKTTFDKFWNGGDAIPSALVKKLPSRIFSKTPGDPSDLWWRDLVRDFRALASSEIPPPYSFGVAFSTISVNPQEYLPWMKSELLSHGVSFERRHVRSLEELRSIVGSNGVLVNASSLGARSIAGVEDSKLIPIRGQTMLVQSPQLQEFLATKADDESTQGGDATYIIPRPGTTYPDTVLLGGTFQVGNWDVSLDMNSAQAIFERCAELAPVLRDRKETKILRHNVGLRPGREGGARVEAEIVGFPLRSAHGLVPWNMDKESGKMHVVHAYGFGPGGYQASWGVAEEVLDLVKALPGL
ncbi:hypothetical protein F5I97DRAFT_1808553 [Phlebopus sp. FC_14]|nr:hypothetical protein F5I97DRAFT_1808553 [Phlebopus sp. FC_14]